MALNTAALDAAANALETTLLFASLHSAAPDGTGSNATSAGRVSISWTGPTSGVLTASNLSFSGIAASGAVTHIGFWSASTAGTWYGAQALTGDQVSNVAGTYVVSGVTVTVSAV